MDMNVEEDDDVVMRELELYVSGSTSCSLLQFPLRPVYADTTIIQDCQFKPTNKKLQMSILGATASAQLHTSSVVCPNGNLCIGVIRNGALHITPISDVYQMRPSFDNVDFDDEEEELYDSVSNKDRGDEKAAIQQVHVRPKESERTKASKEQSYAAVKKRMDEEPGRHMRVHGVDSEEANISFERLYCPQQFPHRREEEISIADTLNIEHSMAAS